MEKPTPNIKTIEEVLTLPEFEPFVRLDLGFSQFNGNVYKLMFPNGHGASVIAHDYSYGIEVGVIDSHFNLDHGTEITDDVIGYLDRTGLIETLKSIKAL